LQLFSVLAASVLDSDDDAGRTSSVGSVSCKCTEDGEDGEEGVVLFVVVVAASDGCSRRCAVGVSRHLILIVVSSTRSVLVIVVVVAVDDDDDDTIDGAIGDAIFVAVVIALAVLLIPEGIADDDDDVSTSTKRSTFAKIRNADETIRSETKLLFRFILPSVVIILVGRSISCVLRVTSFVSASSSRP
jgi:hypothetical protein